MTCDTFNDLIIYYYVKMGLNIIYILLPLIVIVTTLIDLSKAVTNGSEETTRKIWSNLFKRLVTSLLVFLVPTLINSFMYFFKINNYQQCFDMATTENIERLEKEELTKIELEQKKQTEEQKRKVEENRINEIIANNKAGRDDNTVYPIMEGASGSINNTLGIPYYKQCDSRWGKIVYDTSGATLCSSSCGYTSLAMVASGLSRDSGINPYTIVKDIRGIREGEKTKRGYGAASASELTSSKYLTKYGIKANKINKKDIVTYLQRGNPIIVLVPGHYITLSISSNGNIVVMDPYTNWANKARKSGEFESIAKIQSAYGTIKWAAAYSKI